MNKFRFMMSFASASLIYLSLVGQCPPNFTNCTTNFLPHCNCYGNNITLCPNQLPNGTFELGLNGNHNLTIVSLENIAAPTTVISSNGNNWNIGDISENDRAGIDVLLAAQSGVRTFECNFEEYPPFLEPNAQAFINTIFLPGFGGAYAQFGNNRGPHIPLGSSGDFNPETIGHEFGHIYVDNHFPLLQGGFDNYAISESTCDIIGLLVEEDAQGLNDIDWVFKTRSFANGPSSPGSQGLALYGTHEYNQLSAQVRGLTLGHWLFQIVNNSNCFGSTHEAIAFVFDCLGTTLSNGMPVCDFPTLRQATLENIYNQTDDNGNPSANAGCSDCYNDMVNFWNSVGVSGPFNFSPPLITSTIIGPCSFNVTWEDQGIPFYNCVLTLNGNLVSEECISFQNFYSSNISTGNYVLTIEPICDPNGNDCNTADDAPIQIVPIANQGGNLTPVFSADVHMTSCDLIVGGLMDIGLTDNNYSFFFDNNTTPSQPIVIRHEGEIFFHFPIANLPALELNMPWRVDIDYNCGNPPVSYTGIVLQHPNLTVDFQIGIETSSCKVQPTVGANVEFNEASLLRTSISRISETEFDIIQLSGDRTFETNRNFFNANVFDVVRSDNSEAPNIPLVRIPIDMANPPTPTSPQFFVVSLNNSGRLINPGHPLAPEVNCWNRFNSDIIEFQLTGIPGCNGNESVNPTYCINGSLLELDLNFVGNINNISHIEYRYRLNDDPWNTRPCFGTLTDLITIDDFSLVDNSGDCPPDIEVEAQIICICADVCDSPWNNQVVVTDNQCNPPELVSVDRCGDAINIFFEEVPGVYAYKFYFTEVANPPAIANSPQFFCDGNNACVNGTNGTFSVMEYFNPNLCPFQGFTFYSENTLDVLGNPVSFDPATTYLIQVESICCDGANEPVCDSDGQLQGPFLQSQCRLTMEVGPACGIDQNALVLTPLTYSSLFVEWTDNEPEDITYTITAEPDGSICNAPIYVDQAFFPAGFNAQKNHTIDGLMPNTNYIVTISKNCGGATCPSYTSDVSGTATTLSINNNFTTLDICPDNSGAITIELADGNPLTYNFLANGTTGTYDFVNDVLVFEINEADNYLITVDACPGLNWGPFSIAELCVMNISQNASCELDSDYDCENYSIEDWQFSDDGNDWSGTGQDTDELVPDLNGFYRYCIDHPVCGLVCSDSEEITCIVGDIGFDCPPDPNKTTYYIDANLAGMREISEWISPNTVPPGFTALPSENLNDVTLIIKGLLCIDIDLSLTDCNVEIEGGQFNTGLSVTGSLTGRKTNFRSCDGEMWGDISVFGSIDLDQNCTISDARTAIEIDEGSTISIQNTNFENNQTGIGKWNPTASNITTHTSGVFSNNTFIAGDIGRYGMRLWGFNFHYKSSVQSTFTGFSKGIWARNSVIEISNIKTDETFRGIHAEDMVSLVLKNAEYNSCTVGLDFEDSPMATFKIEDITVNSEGRTGLSVSNCDMAVLKVEDLETNGCSRGFDLSSNNFDFAELDDISINDGSDGGARLYASHNVVINGNHISNYSGWSGIYARNCNNLEIEFLTVHDNSDQVCIWLYGGENASLRNNTFNSSTGWKDRVTSTGIKKLFACENTFNASSNQRNIVLDNNSNGVLRQNIHNRGSRAIWIQGSSIGINDYAGNQFYDMTRGFLETSLEPRFSRFIIKNDNSPKIPPGGSNLSQQEFEEWFFVDDAGSHTWSSCSTSDPYNKFRPEDDPSCCCVNYPSDCIRCCPDPVPPQCEDIIEHLTQIMKGQNVSALSASAQYDLKLDWIRHYLSKIGLTELSPETLIDCFEEYDEGEAREGEGNETVGFGSGTPVSAALVSQVRLKEKMNAAYDLNGRQEYVLSALRYRITEISNKSELDMLQEMDDIIDSFTKLRKAYSNKIKVASETILNTIDQGGGSLIQRYHNNILEIEAYLMMHELAELPEQYLDMITEIAPLCAYDFGDPVYTSRILLEELGGPMLDTYHDELICNGANIERREAEYSATSTKNAQVFPNPSSGIITVSGVSDYADIAIYNIEGNQVYSQTLNQKDQNIEIDLSSETVGIYYITLNGKAKTRHLKFILVN